MQTVNVSIGLEANSLDEIIEAMNIKEKEGFLQTHFSTVIASDDKITYTVVMTNPVPFELS